ncbi:hypothetical protein D3D02_14170 [Halobellus sp. Atlit-38R]|jgi:hypothetical protein|uniref:hypothetical protein n=1 Tax=Halobellus sp. Atlit-38R TaxID=2282131 RepID=UPI000EF1D639|nr:hypothetical protein [Halobellus sp. Atlit-38R]RLM87863.1 hypothetical protein D3D02_14170 [Halobellus sp. Atlit-38R]
MSRAVDSDADPGDRVYHVVCHDCPTEHLTERAAEAEKLFSEHRSVTDHDVDVAALRAPDAT